MSCSGTSFVRRHLYFRVTTSLLTVLPQLAHLDLLQASISLGFFTCMNPTALQASWPDVTGQFSCWEATAFTPLLFCLPDTPLAPFPLLSSSTQLLTQWGMPCPWISQGFFLSQEKTLSSPHWISQCFAMTYQCLGQSLWEERTSGDKGRHPTTSREHRWHYCNTKVLSYCSLYLKFCTRFCKVLSTYK